MRWIRWWSTRLAYLIDHDGGAGRRQPERRRDAADAEMLVVRAVILRAAESRIAEDLAGVGDLRLDRCFVIELDGDRTVFRRRVDLARGGGDGDAAVFRARGDAAAHVANRNTAVRRGDVEPRALRHAEDHVHPPRLALVDLRTGGADLAVAECDVDRAEGARRLLLREADRLFADDQPRDRLVPAFDRHAPLLAVVNLEDVDSLQRHLLLFLRARGRGERGDVAGVEVLAVVRGERG